ncbi:armadillo-type protein [Hyaloraphidium curvatum]|nr:armadillo-type protein [Hyaloraphidium curvatum]
METAAENDASLDEAPSLGPDASVADTHDSGDGHEHNAAAFFEEADEAEGLIRGLVEKLREGSGPRAGPDAYCRVDRDAAAESSENPWCRTTPEEEAACVRIKRIFLKYQEQPHLLDPFLSRMITPTVTCLRDVILEAYEMDVSNSDSGEVSGWPQMTALVENARVHQLLEVLYGICSVRGSKTTVRLFTNSPAELTPLLAFLSLIPRPSVDYRPWASRFVVLLWLSLVVMVPFDLRTIDSSAALTVEGDEGRPGLLRQIIESCKNMFAQATGKDGEAAGILLARLLGRSDALEDDELNAFLSWAARDVFGPNHEPDTANVHLAKNTLYALCLLLKYSLRSHLLPCLDALSSVLFTMVPNEEETTGSSKTGGALRTQVLQKLLVKYAGRLGELLMPPRNRDLPRSGITALQDNLRGNSQSTCREGARPDPHAADNDGDESDVPEAMEPLLSFLLSELSAPSSAVRWVAAKALSRICSRLPRAFAAEVVEAAIGGFSENVLPNGASPDAADLSQCSDATWHGTLLLLAALIRAHALSRPLISACVPWVLRALTFDHKRGSQIMGIGVRDAACYVLWALARSNPGDIERLDTQSIGRHLVCTAMFDREVNVRRAASAAFQEGVGRFRDDQRYSNGIDVLRALDFWTIGNVRKCYRTVAVAVAAHEAYLPAILAHLTKHCIGHWDIQLRILASLALEGLAETSLAPVIDYSWTMLIDRTKDLDSAKVHGAVLAVAELCLAAGKSASPAGAEKLDLLESCRATTIVSQAATILGGARMAILEQATPTSDMLLAAYVRLVECLSLSRASLDGNGVAAAFCILELALSRKLESLQRSAARAYGALVYLVPETLDRTRVDELLRGVVPTEDAAGLSFFRRRGCAMVLGQLPSAHVLVSAVAISRSLRLGMQKAPSKRGSRTVYIRSTVTGEAEAKCECVASLVRTCVVVLEATFAGGARPEDVAVVVGETLSALTRGMLDYSVDSRGDVGSWVREASMRGFGTLLPALLLVHSQAPISSFEDYKVTDIFGGILQQSVEKIDRVRTCAGSTLRALLSERRCLNAIEDAEALKDVLLAEPGHRWDDGQPGEERERWPGRLSRNSRRLSGRLRNCGSGGNAHRDTRGSAFHDQDISDAGTHCHRSSADLPCASFVRALSQDSGRCGRSASHRSLAVCGTRSQQISRSQEAHGLRHGCHWVSRARSRWPRSWCQGACRALDAAGDRPVLAVSPASLSSSSKACS